MRRGKDEEKIMRPMFPRLHVNDTEKGGPRAPPRNKMALYEQLSIPSQRFSHGVLPHNPATNFPDVVPPASSIQEGGNERGKLLPRQLHARDHTEKLYRQYSDLSYPLTQVGLKKQSDEDDFTVPVFINSRPSQDPSQYFNDTERETLPLSNPRPNHSMNQSSIIGCGSQESKRQNEENLKDFVACQDPLAKAITNSSSIKTGGLQKQQEDPGDSIERLKTNSRTQVELSADLQPATTFHSNVSLKKHATEREKGNSSVTENGLPSEEQNDVHDISNGAETREEKSDSVSETSMVDSISGSGYDISPDDIVRVIGQKHFWKARRAIINQQKAFAVQVFELHRLIKVQRSIAGSPHLLLEDAAYLRKPVKASSLKKLPLEYSVKVPSNVSKRKTSSEKPSHQTECSAENTVEKASPSAVQSGVPPYSGNPAPPSASGANNFGAWCFNQPNGQQWLIPVMSPSEGLVYKPCPGTGFMGPVIGGSMPNRSSTVYGYPAPHYQYQLPSFPPAEMHGYFPPYGMPRLNPVFSCSSVEQVNQVAAHDQSSAEEANPSSRRQYSFDTPGQKNNVFRGVSTPLASKDSEFKAGTSGNPSGSGKGDAMEERDMLRLFPTSPSLDVPNSSPQPPENERPAQVIKVVPHAAISATESAARIFRSIQEERRKYDAV